MACISSLYTLFKSFQEIILYTFMHQILLYYYNFCTIICFQLEMALDDAEACTPNDDVREKEGGGAARELVHLREMDKK